MHTAKTFAAPAAFAAALCAATTAMASMDTWQENAATPFVTINVASDMTLSDALTAGGVTLTGAAALVKTGGGTVTVDDASGIGSFAGEIHVFQGGWSVGTASGFGTSAGATWVYPNGCVLVTDVTISHAGETFHLAGTGMSDWNGWGAIRFPKASQGSETMAAGAYGSRWILEGDATILLSGNGASGGTARSFLTTIDLELNGHELTLWLGKHGALKTGWSEKSQYGLFKSVTGAGGIVLKNGVSFSTYEGFNPKNWTYTDGNYICLQNAYMGFQKVTSKAGWRLVTRALAGSDWNDPAAAAGLKPLIYLWNKNGNDGSTKSYNAWSGPVTLGCDLQIRQSGQTYTESMTFTNKVSGAGGLAVTTGKTWLYLDCPENDFEGGVTLYGPDNRLVLANDGALPADGGRLLMTNSTVAFPATVSADWSLPALELAGTSVVQNCQGRWTSVTALLGADASYESVLGADAMTLKQGAKLALRAHAYDGAYQRPDFAALAMESGSVLDLDNEGLAVGTATGSGAVTNGHLTVTQALVVSPGVFEDGGIAVDGNLVLGAGAKISFPNSDSLRKRDAGSFTLATASGTISGFTGSSMLEIDGSHKCWKANLSADGKTLMLELAPEATVLTFR